MEAQEKVSVGRISSTFNVLTFSRFGLLLSVLFSASLYAQDVVWASKVVSHTSQVSSSNYSASKVLGKPNAPKDTATNAWQPNGSGKEESIVVAFDSPIKAKQILIVESMNTGYIRRVSAIDAHGMEYEVAHFPAKSGGKGPHLMRINVADFNINISSVKIVMVPIKYVPATIDAIGITMSDKPFMITKTHQVEMAEHQ